MIRKIKFNNFYSFDEEQEIDFVARKKTTYDYYQSKSGHQITKVAGFVGSNASGKTNIMRLFSFLSYFICTTGKELSKEDSSPTLDIPYKTFFNNDKKSDFCIEFEEKDEIFLYELSVRSNTIRKEVLSLLDPKKPTWNKNKTIIFSRKINEIAELNENYFKDFSVEFTENNIRSDISLIAFLSAHYKIKVIKTVYDYFLGLKTNINEKGQLNNVFHQLKALSLYIKDEDVKNEMEDFVRLFDVGVSGFEIKKGNKEKDNLPISVKGIHTTKEKNNKLDFGYESRGTQSLFYALANILVGLKNNNVIIIDEIECGFHPAALDKLISYFVSENKNSKAQLIFSSHSLGFMNRFDMHQIYLVEKSEESSSSVYRLNEVEGVRTDENFLTKYMTGAYGAFPKIRV